MGKTANFHIMSGGQAIDSLGRKVLLNMQKRVGFVGGLCILMQSVSLSDKTKIDQAASRKNGTVGRDI